MERLKIFIPTGKLLDMVDQVKWPRHSKAYILWSNSYFAGQVPIIKLLAKISDNSMHMPLKDLVVDKYQAYVLNKDPSLITDIYSQVEALDFRPDNMRWLYDILNADLLPDERTRQVTFIFGCNTKPIIINAKGIEDSRIELIEMPKYDNELMITDGLLNNKIESMTADEIEEVLKGWGYE